MNEKFENACNRVEQSCPPIWMMRQAGRYQQPYMEMKEKFTFEQMCKLPRVAADVAMLPIDQFHFDIAEPYICSFRTFLSDRWPHYPASCPFPQFIEPGHG